MLLVVSPSQLVELICSQTIARDHLLCIDTVRVRVRLLALITSESDRACEKFLLIKRKGIELSQGLAHLVKFSISECKLAR